MPHLCAVLLCACVSPFSVLYFLVYHSVTKLLSVSSIVELEPKSIFVFLLLKHMCVILTCFCLCFLWCVAYPAQSSQSRVHRQVLGVSGPRRFVGCACVQREVISAYNIDL